MISDAELLKQINEMQAFNASFSQSYGEPLSFFELLTLIALNIFKEQAVDVRYFRRLVLGFSLTQPM